MGELTPEKQVECLMADLEVIKKERDQAKAEVEKLKALLKDAEGEVKEEKETAERYAKYWQEESEKTRMVSWLLKAAVKGESYEVREFIGKMMDSL